MSEKFKNDKFSNPSCLWVIDQNIILYVLIDNARTAWVTQILRPFLSFSEFP